MQKPSEDGSARPSQDTRRSSQGSDSSSCSREALGGGARHRSRAAAECSFVLLVHGSSSRRGGAHLNEDRLSVASWPLPEPSDDCSSSSSGSSIGSTSRLCRHQDINDESDSPSSAVSAYAASINSSGGSSSCSSSNSSIGNRSRSNSNIADSNQADVLFWRQPTKEQEQQKEQHQHKWLDSGSSSSPSLSCSSSPSFVCSPQGLLLGDDPQTPGRQLLLPLLDPAAADAAAAETLAATPTPPAAAAAAAPAVGSKALRLCVRRPGLPAAYFSLDARQQPQHTKAQQQQQQQHKQQQQQQRQQVHGGVASSTDWDCLCVMRSRECRRVVEETRAAAAAAAAAAAKPARDTAAGDRQQVVPVDAALAALVQGRAGPLDRQRQQQQRRLCHAAAPCEGWGVSVCAASCCSSSVSAAETVGGSQQQGAKTSAVTAPLGQQQQQQKHQQQQQQPQRQQQQLQGQEGCLGCCSFLLSVFDGHDSDTAAEFASQALPLLAAKFLPQQVTSGEEQQVAAAAAAAFTALDDLFRKRCRVIQRVTGAACTSGCCALSAFIQGSHLFVFNLGDCRCAFLALGDLEEVSKPVAAAQQQQQQQQEQQHQQQLDCSDRSTPMPLHSWDKKSSSRSSRSSSKPSFLSQTGPMRAVCRASPSLRAALKRAGAEEGSAAMASEDSTAAAAAGACTFDQRPYTPLLPPPETAAFPLPVSHKPLLTTAAAAAADILDAQQQGKQQDRGCAARESSQCGWRSSSSTNCSTRRASFAAQTNSCCCNSHASSGCSECAGCSLASRNLQSSSRSSSSSGSSSKTEKAGITFHWLSRDLRASAPYEMQRLRSLNATVEGGRLGGVLEPSRSVGDFDVKDSQPKGALSCIPEAAYLRLTGPGLLLLASDGFWDFVGPEEIIKCLQQIQGVWRPLVKAARQFLEQQQQQQRRRHQAPCVASPEKHESPHARAGSGSSSCEVADEDGDIDLNREEGGPTVIHVPTAAALSRLSDRLLRRAKRLGSEDDTTCLVAFIKPIFPL